MSVPTAPGDNEYQRLRAEWQRFKSHVVDPYTELPTLAAVLDDVRRLMEERGTLGLLYLDLSAAGRAEARYGSETYDRIVYAFAQALRGLGADGQLGARDIIAVMSVRSDKFLLFMRGSDAPDGPSALEGRARRLRQHITRALERALPPGVKDAPDFRQGHALMYRDPMLRAERSIHRALDEAMFMALREREGDETHRTQGLDEIIGRGGVVTLYQPILELDTMRALGHEVFTRGPAGGPFEDAERLFALAERTGRLLELEKLCRTRALSSARLHLDRGRKLFLNTSARALVDPEVWGKGFVRQVDEQGFPHEDVVLEVSEKLAGEERVAYRSMLHQLKREGFGIAIEDMGSGYSTLQSLVELEPDYLKFEIGMARHLERDPIRRSVLETLVELSHKIGARVIAAGIEAETELLALRALGVPLGQGRHLAPPVMITLEPAAVP
ncbi:MAG TPA: EAL domain-containing protein [Vicinamibacteria bacterium]|nr:EAL domain-containing protein [Vicinamibacteria bacterium]